MCTILFNVYFDKFVISFIDIGEIGCVSMPKCHWMVIVVNLLKTWFFCMVTPVRVLLCMQSQYQVFPPLAAIIAARHRGTLATMCCRRSSGIAGYLSSRVWRSLPRFWGGFSILVIAWPNSCFAKYPCRAHWWSFCPGSQGGIWPRCEELLRCAPIHY